MSKSLARTLPIFNMAGTDFFVDIQLNEFRQTNDPYNHISIDEINEDPDTNQLGILFDKHTRNVSRERGDPGNIPEHIALVIIPDIIGLDPIGWARKYGLADDAFTQ